MNFAVIGLGRVGSTLLIYLVQAVHSPAWSYYPEV
jgi:Trk K+ transport system NAD-binding subunit